MSHSNTIIALFNYGGGMRGLIPAHFMSQLEEVTGLRMIDMIDVFTGPSTGAILNAAMTLPHPDHPTRPKYRARHLVRFYEREGLRIFPQDRFREFRGFLHDFNNRTMKIGQLQSLMRHGHYDPANLGLALRALYGHTKLGQSLRSLVVPVYNIDRAQLEMSDGDGKGKFIGAGGHALWLKNMKLDGPGQTAHRTPDVELYEAVMASCAAPSYYPCHHFELNHGDGQGPVGCTGIDGSIFDNPCVSYLGALKPHLPKDCNLIMIVLGTGYTNRSINRDQWNRYGALGVVDPVNDLPLISILFHASESALMETFRDEMSDRLYVFNSPLYGGRDDPRSPSQQIDDGSPENLKRLDYFFQDMMEENKKKFDDLCHMLVSHRDGRQAERGTGLGDQLRRAYEVLTRRRG